MDPTAARCPRCGGDCRAVDLDRGELERLLNAETRAQPFAANPAGAARERWDRRDRGRQPERRRMGFFGDLFD